MKDSLENKLTMYGAVVSLLEANAAKIGPLTALTDQLTDLKDRIAAIKEKDTLANTASKGNASAKAADRIALMEDALTIVSALSAYGASTNDERLIELSAYNKSRLYGLRDTQLAIDVANIKSLADANSASLAGYGITPAMITELETKLTTFNASMGTKETGADVSSTAFEQLDIMFKDVDNFLKDQMDKTMKYFRNSDPQFYGEYVHSREIIDLGVRHKDEEGPEPPEGPENQ